MQQNVFSLSDRMAHSLNGIPNRTHFHSIHRGQKEGLGVLPRHDRPGVLPALRLPAQGFGGEARKDGAGVQLVHICIGSQEGTIAADGGSGSMPGGSGDDSDGDDNLTLDSYL